MTHTTITKPTLWKKLIALSYSAKQDLSIITIKSWIGQLSRLNKIGFITLALRLICNNLKVFYKQEWCKKNQYFKVFTCK